MNHQDSTGPIVPPSSGKPTTNPGTLPPASQPPDAASFFGWVLAFLRRSATIFKMAGVTALILLLLIPLTMIRSVLTERLKRRDEAVANITSSWGASRT